MRTRKRLSSLQNETEQTRRVCVRDRAVVFKESEAEETIPVESIPLIEEILADMLFASWVSQRGAPASSQQTQKEEKDHDSNPTETNFSA